MRLPALLQRDTDLLRFDDLAEALLFDAEQRGRNESPPSALGHRDAMAPTARAAKETYTALVGCLARSPEDYPFDPEVTPERVEKLLRYYVSEENPPRGEALEECRKVRNVLRRRMKARGLLTR